MKTLTHESKCTICGTQLMSGSTVPDNADVCMPCVYRQYERAIPVLPELTPKLYDEFESDTLVGWHDGPQWTQVAVDFACLIWNSSRKP